MTSAAEKAATCLSAALLTAYHPSCKLLATMCLVSLMLFSFAFVILLAQFLRQEHCLLRERGILGLLAWENLETWRSVLYKSYPEQRPGAQTLEVTPLSPHRYWIKLAILHLWGPFVSFCCHGFCSIFWCIGQEADNQAGPLCHTIVGEPGRAMVTSLVTCE